MATIEAHYVDQFRGHLAFLNSTKVSKLRGTVTVTDLRGKSARYDDYGETEMQEKTERFAPTPLNTVDHLSRWIYSRTYDQGLGVDWQDVLRVLADPQNHYVERLNRAINRKIDNAIINAFEATAKAGETANEDKVFDTNMVVDVQTRDAGVSATDLGLNVAKLLKAGELLDDAEVEPGEERYLLCPPRQLTSLLSSVKVQSADYNEIMALKTGKIDKYAGFTFIMLPKKYLKVDGNSDDKCYFWMKSGMLMAMAKEPMVRIDPRPDRSYATQIYAALDFGVTRMNEQKVGYIECDPATGPGV